MTDCEWQLTCKCVLCCILLVVTCLCALRAAGAQLGPVGGVSSQVPPAALPADSRVCVGLAVGPLLDVSLRHRQHHAAVRAGGLRLVETLVSGRLQVPPGVLAESISNLLLFPCGNKV